MTTAAFCSSGASKACFMCFLFTPSNLVVFVSIETASNGSSSGVSYTVIRCEPLAYRWSSCLGKIVGNILAFSSKHSLYLFCSSFKTMKVSMKPDIYSCIPGSLPRARMAILPSGWATPHFKWSLSSLCWASVYSNTQLISSVFSTSGSVNLA